MIQRIQMILMIQTGQFSPESSYRGQGGRRANFVRPEFQGSFVRLDDS
jgi:hypothetical protein